MQLRGLRWSLVLLDFFYKQVAPPEHLVSLLLINFSFR
jgi:hypothetical protein